MLLKKHINKIIIIFTINLLIPITSFSKDILSHNEKEDSLITITESELKEVNIIFLDHRRLLDENKILNNQILKLEDVIFGYNQIDSLRKIEQEVLNNVIKEQNIPRSLILKILQRSKPVKILHMLIIVNYLLVLRYFSLLLINL